MSGLLDSNAPGYTGRLMDPTEAGTYYEHQDSQAWTPDKEMKGIDQNLFQAPTGPDDSGSFSKNALMSRAQGRFSEKLSNMGFQSQLSSMNNLQRQRLQNYEFSKQVQSIVQNVNERRHVAEMNKVAARNQVIGNIVSVGGAIVGGIYGGPMGAAMGAQAGRLVPGQGMHKASPRSNVGNTGVDAGNYDFGREAATLGERPNINGEESFG
jgi:hypothetical protein